MNKNVRKKRNEYFDKEILPKIKDFCVDNELKLVQYGIGHFRVFNTEKITVDFWKSGTHGTVSGEYIRFDAGGIIPELKVLTQATNKQTELVVEHRTMLKDLSNKINNRT